MLGGEARMGGVVCKSDVVYRYTCKKKKVFVKVEREQQQRREGGGGNASAEQRGHHGGTMFPSDQPNKCPKPV